MDYPLPALLIAVPLVVAVITLAIGRWRRMATGIGVVTALGIAVLALMVGRGDGPVVALWIVAGRAFEPTPFVTQLIGLLAFGVTVLFILHWLAPGPQSIVPSGLAALAFLGAALMVQPFAFGATFLVAATAVAVPSLVGGRFFASMPSWRAFLAVALAMPLLVAAGALLDAGQAEIGTEISLLLVASLLLLGGFPFYVWISGVAREAPLHAVALLMGIIAAGVAVWLAQVLDQFPAARGSTVFQSAVVGSVVASSLIAAFGLLRVATWRNWLVYGLVFDAGLQVATLAVPGTAAIAVITAGALGRMLVLLLLVALAACTNPELSLSGDGPSGWRRIVLAYIGLSFLGLPLTPAFVARWETFTSVASQSPIALALLLLAMGMAAVAGVRWALVSYQPFFGMGQSKAVAGLTVATLLIIALFMGVFGPVLLDYLVKLASG